MPEVGVYEAAAVLPAHALGGRLAVHPAHQLRRVLQLHPQRVVRAHAHIGEIWNKSQPFDPMFVSTHIK